MKLYDPFAPESKQGWVQAPRMFAANEARADIDSRGASWSLQSAGRRQLLGSAALPAAEDYTAPGRRSTQAARGDSFRHWAKYGGTHRPCAVFLGGLTRPKKVSFCKNAVRIGNSSRLRGRGGLSRGAQNLLRTEESTSEKQVSCEAEDSYFPSCGAFWCLGDNWAADFMSVVQRVSAACIRAIPGRLGSSCLPFLVIILLDMKLCNVWVLSCQHQLQILASRGADRSVWGDADHFCVAGKCATTADELSFCL